MNDASGEIVDAEGARGVRPRHGAWTELPGDRSEALRVGKTSVGEFVRLADVIGITWPLPEELDDGELERRLFTAPCGGAAGAPGSGLAKLHEGARSGVA